MEILPKSLPYRQKLSHGIPSWVRGEIVLFITICCSSRGLDQLCSKEIFTAIGESIAFRQRRGDWQVSLWLLMPDHLHALVSIPKEKDPAKVISNWKEIIAKKTGVKWQRDFFEHRLRSAQDYRQKADYICQNPVRKGLVSKAEDWKFVWTS